MVFSDSVCGYPCSVTLLVTEVMFGRLAFTEAPFQFFSALIAPHLFPAVLFAELSKTGKATKGGLGSLYLIQAPYQLFSALGTPHRMSGSLELAAAGMVTEIAPSPFDLCRLFVKFLSAIITCNFHSLSLNKKPSA